MADQNVEREPLEVLAAEYMERLRQGEQPSVEDYATQHPALAEEIRELFPTIAVTERLKARQARSSGGRATLGPARLERLGDFRIIREIGRGGMGVVFEAEQESLGRRVAVKVLPRQVLLDEKHLKRFEREARIAANLHHTNIVEVFGVGEQEGFHYYVMQYIEGVGLDAIVPELAKTVRGQGSSLVTKEGDEGRKNGVTGAVRQLLGEEGAKVGRLDTAYWRNVARIGLQAAEALSYAHGQGVLHRDIKPANLLLGSQGTVWLTDFGLAKAAQSEDVSLTRDMVGTLRYMAPEQFQGQTNQKSDIYSLGLTLYELLALKPAFEEADQSRLMQRIVQGPPSPPGATTLGIPRDLETIILKAIRPEAGNRYASAGDLAQDLQCFLEDRPIHARRVGPMERLGRWCRRNPAMAGLVGTTLFLLVLMAVVSSVGYVRTKRALDGEATERAKAEANAILAAEALDRTFERLYPTRMGTRTQPTIDGSRGDVSAMPNAPILSKETAALLEEMLPFYDRLAQQIGNGDDLRFRTAEANRRVGAIRQRLGQSEDAVKAYQRAITLFRELDSRSPTNSNHRLKMAQIQNELGRLFTAQRQFTEARQSHRAALSLLQPIAADPSASPAVKFELARTYFFLGLRERPLPTAGPPEREGPMPESNEQRDSLAKAVTLLRTLSVTPLPNPEYQHLLALCYLEGAPPEDGRQGERRGDERAIELLEALAKGYPDVADYAYDLSEAYTKMHIPRPPIPREMEKEIEQHMGRALALLEQLVAKHPDVPDFLAFEARVLHKLGSFFQQTDRWAEAESSFRKATVCQSRLVEQFPDSPYYGLWMATFRIALADALIRRDHPGEARTELEQAISTLLRQLEQTPETYRPHDLLALGYSKLAIVLRQLGERDQADEAERKAEQEKGPVHR